MSAPGTISWVHYASPTLRYNTGRFSTLHCRVHSQLETRSLSVYCCDEDSNKPLLHSRCSTRHPRKALTTWNGEPDAELRPESGRSHEQIRESGKTLCPSWGGLMKMLLK